MIEPDMARLAEKLEVDLTPENHNTIIRWLPFIGKLVRDNPGAATWAMHRKPQGTLDPEHPGDIIRAVRSELEKNGLAANSWRYFATRDPKIVAKLASQEIKEATQVMNAMAKTRETPHPKDIEDICRRLWQNQERWGFEVWAQQKNRVLELLIPACRRAREQGEDPKELTRHIYEVRDYINAQGQEITATTWNGLMKAQQRWHREWRWQQAEQQMEEAIRKAGGVEPRWESLIESVTIDDLEFTAITDARSLFAEGAQMDHCVGTYWERCMDGSARIFRVSQNGKVIGTTEIAKQHGTWRQTQTRGKWNGDVDQDVCQAVDTLAGRYNQANKELAKKESAEKEARSE